MSRYNLTSKVDFPELTEFLPTLILKKFVTQSKERTSQLKFYVLILFLGFACITKNSQISNDSPTYFQSNIRRSQILSLGRRVPSPTGWHVQRYGPQPNNAKDGRIGHCSTFATPTDYWRKGNHQSWIHLNLIFVPFHFLLLLFFILLFINFYHKMLT